MAAGDFTATQIQVAQATAVSMFPSAANITTPQYNQPAATSRAMLLRQRATTSGRFAGRNECVGVDIHWFKPSAATVSAPGTCATPGGTEGESAKQSYDNEILARASVTLEDNRCDNLITFAEELSQQQQHCMAILRRELNNTIIIPRLSAASMTNLDTFINPSWDYTTADPRIIVPEADFTYSNLNEFRILAENNEFSSDMFILSGRFFNDDKWMAMLNAANETMRNQMLAWDQREIYFDSRDLDKTMTRKTAFAIDAGAYCFWNIARNTPTPVLEDASTNRFVFTVPDPILTYRDGATVRPVMYEFELQKTCLERGTNDFRRYTYNLYGRLIGGFKFVPEGPNGETGVMQFAAE